jgi:hypothetical protein
MVGVRPASSSTKPELIANTPGLMSNTPGLILLRRPLFESEACRTGSHPRSEQSPEPDLNRRPLPYALEFSFPGRGRREGLSGLPTGRLIAGDRGGGGKAFDLSQSSPASSRSSSGKADRRRQPAEPFDSHRSTTHVIGPPLETSRAHSSASDRLSKSLRHFSSKAKATWNVVPSVAVSEPLDEGACWGLGLSYIKVSNWNATKDPFDRRAFR